MPRKKGYKQIRPEDGVQFQVGNKAAEKWTEPEALRFGNDLLEWMKIADENIFFDDFIYLQDHSTKKYAGDIYPQLITRLRDKYSSFAKLYENCRKIEETKLKKFSAFDKLNASISKFLLSAEYGLSDKTNIDHTTQGEKINPDTANMVKDVAKLIDERTKNNR